MPQVAALRDAAARARRSLIGEAAAAVHEREAGERGGGASALSLQAGYYPPALGGLPAALIFTAAES